MDRGFIALTMIPVMLSCFALGMPFYAAMGTVGLGYGLLFFGTKVLPIADMKVYGFFMEPSFAGVPMFVLMGTILSTTGIAEVLFSSVYKFFGRARGGLLIAVGVVCTLMAACTGVSSGVTATMGITALPTMLKLKYEKGIATGCIAATSTLGTLIPPSNMLIIMALQANVPIGRLYFAAFTPGFMTAGLFLLYFFVKAWLSPYDAPGMNPEDIQNTDTFKNIVAVTRDVLPVLFLVFGVLGTIYLGVATPTEGAGVGALGALILSVVYRKFTFRSFHSAVRSCYRVTAMTAAIMIGANFFSSVFLAMGGGTAITNLTITLGLGRDALILITLAINFVLGFVMSGTAIILILIPIFMPPLMRMGVNDLWFLMLFAMMSQVGYITPPWAPGIFLLKPLAPPEVKLTEMYVGIIPFIILELVATVLIWYFPAIATWLPNQMVK